MKTKLVLFLMLISVLMVKAQKPATITGKITTTDGHAATGITVTVLGKSLGTLTDASGYYKIKNLPLGNQMIQLSAIGIQSQSKNVEIKYGENVNVDFVISETTKELEEVAVNALRAHKYIDKESDQVARIPLKNLENPQVYTVIPKELIKNQLSLNSKDVINNAAGVVAYYTPIGTVSAWIRGFDTRNAIRNGMVTQYRAESDPINIERIEVIKGPAGTLFGSSAISFGGLINKITKTPNPVTATEVAVFTGSNGLMRITADVNTPLNASKTSLFRLNAAYHAEDSFQDIGRYKSISAAPSFLYKINDRLTFLVDAEFAAVTRTQQPYPSFGPNTTFKNFKDIPIDYKKYIGGDDVDSKTTISNFFTKATYKLSDQWVSSTNLNFSNGYVDYANQLYPRWLTDSTMTRNIGMYSARTLSFIQFQQNFNGDFKIGKMRNRAVIGADFTSTITRLNYAYFNYDTINVNKNFSPLFAQRANALMAATKPGYYQNTQTNYSLYASDVINLTERLLVMASLRLDQFVNKASIEYNQPVKDDYQQTALSPKFGMIYQIVDQKVSVFGNYMNGFLNQGPVTQPDGSTLRLKPKQANQWEGGVKTDLLNKHLGFTLSFYDIKVNHATYTDINNFSLQGGTQKSKGFEAELNAEPFDHFYILSGYARNSNKFISGESSLIGKKVAGAPGEVFNLWMNYQCVSGLLKNFGGGFGGNYVSDVYWDAANTITIPSYTVLNATVSYHQPTWTASVKMNNLSNQKYWNSDAQPQMLRQIIGSVAMKF
ncbi:TonB-dependent receptor [Pedobacter sp. R20-19]|uniref:TonB-dependent receptor n=1 Tax=Pedobacter sp. R20-19 TaxID=1270196 RepID=UPI000493AD2E|nr:TonB-dependent receptor [Pedobacter sp. R20-19]